MRRSGTIRVDAACTSAQRDPGGTGTFYARRHTFTVAVPLRAVISLEAAATGADAVDPYLVVLEGLSGDGTGAVAGRDDNSGTGSAALLTIELAPGRYTIEATTAAAGTTGAYRLGIDATAGARAPCTTDLGTLTAGRYTRTGTITAHTGCTSAHRPGAPHARWHTFTLDAPAWIDIDHAPAPDSTLDPYLVLLEGDNSTGTVLGEDNDSGTDTAAQIRGRYLDPGTYTIETTAATTTGNTATGAYTLTVTVPIHGLAATNNVTVDEQTTLTFTYWPATRSVSFGSQSLSADILYDHFGFSHSAALGSASVTIWPDRGTPHELELSLGAASSGSSTRANQGQARTRGPTIGRAGIVDSPRQYLFRIFSRCGPGERLSPNNRILCVSASSNVEVRTPGKETPVTTGVLLAIDHVAKEAVQLYARPCSNGLTVKPRQIAALLLAIAIYELDMSKDDYVYRYPARSAMGLSRQDFEYPFYYSREANGTFGPKRAFWHVGVGMFQLDDRFGDGQVNAMTHADRADIYVGGKLTAKYIVQEICKQPDDSNATISFVSQAKKATRPWLGCKRNGVEKCVDQTYPNLYIEQGDDLYVTNYLASPDPSLPANPRVPPFPHNHTGDFSSSGAIKKMTCRWDSNRSYEFDCYFYDTANPEGWFDRATPTGASVRQTSPSPLAAPFFSVTGRVRRAVVFPASFLGSADTWIRSVPFGRKIHETAEANREVSNPDPRLRIDWTRNEHDFGDGVQRTLEVRTRIRPASEGGPACGWVSVNDNGSAPDSQNLARCVRYMYPNQD